MTILTMINYRQETLFCVSSSLVCDGINHCPSGEEYNSDEDPNMCAQKRGLTDSNVRVVFFVELIKFNVSIN